MSLERTNKSSAEFSEHAMFPRRQTRYVPPSRMNGFANRSRQAKAANEAVREFNATQAVVREFKARANMEVKNNIVAQNEARAAANRAAKANRKAVKAKQEYARVKSVFSA